MRKIDDFLIDRIFQPIAWWFEAETEKNNFWLAKLFGKSAVFLSIGLAFLVPLVEGVFAIGMSACLIIMVSRSVEQLESVTRKGFQNHWRNGPFAKGFLFIRLFFLFAVLWSFSRFCFGFEGSVSREQFAAR